MSENRVRVNVMLDPMTVERLRDAAAATPGETISSIVEKGALARIAELEQGSGGPIPKRKGGVKTGRPRKAVA